VDADKRVVGILTDRDICKAVATLNRLASDVPAVSLATKPVVTCGVDEDLQSVLQTMRTRHIRRLPAVDSANKLQGILSMDDVILHAEERGIRAQTVTFADAVRTLKGIYSTRPLPATSIVRP
jgi:predicted transcriptional regulator